MSRFPTFISTLLFSTVIGEGLAVPTLAAAQSPIAPAPVAGPKAPAAAAPVGDASPTAGPAQPPPPPPPPPPPAAPGPVPAVAPEDLPPADPSPAKGVKGDAAAPAPAAAEETDVTRWEDRERQQNESTTLLGGSGLLHTQHAETGAPGQFRVGFVGEWFSAGFLCTSDFSCRDPSTGAAVTSDSLDHIGGTLTLGATLVKLGAGSLEGYGAIAAYANSDTSNRPALLQVLGDSDIGLKYAAPVGRVLRLGVFSELWLVNGTGSIGLDGSGTSARAGGIATADFRGLSSPTPLRVSFNATYTLDNTAQVIESTEAARRGQITRIERYGLGINRVDHGDFYLGVEGLLAEERVRPFLEGHILAAVNRQDYKCNTLNLNHDHCLANDIVAPAVLTVGGRFFPWKRGFSLLAAIDIGLSGTSDFIEELQPVAPWTLFLGAGWSVDTWEHPPVVQVVEKPVETAPPTVRVVGFVHEKDKNDPVVSAIVAYRDHADLSPLSTAADGRFGDDVPEGTYTYEIRAEGFKPGTCQVTATRSSSAPPPATEPTPAVASSAATAPPAAPSSAPADAKAPAPASTPAPPTGRAEVDIDCPLEALPRVGNVTGHVRDADTNQPLAGLQVVLADAQRKEQRFATDASGGFHFDAVSPGSAQLSLIADGYLAIVTPTDVKARQESSVDLLLRPKPKNPEVQVTAKELTIRNQVQFALDSSVILPQSFGLLTEVADTVIRHPEIRRIEVQGHTDNSGTPEHNRSLSEERAEAVRSWLVQHGVPSDRLVAKGYGQDSPLVPNVTANNRARNRRVQFIILERDGAEKPKKGLPGF